MQWRGTKGQRLKNFKIWILFLILHLCLYCNRDWQICYRWCKWVFVCVCNSVSLYPFCCIQSQKYYAMSCIFRLFMQFLKIFFLCNWYEHIYACFTRKLTNLQLWNDGNSLRYQLWQKTWIPICVASTSRSASGCYGPKNNWFGYWSNCELVISLSYLVVNNSLLFHIDSIRTLKDQNANFILLGNISNSFLWSTVHITTKTI